MLWRLFSGLQSVFVAQTQIVRRFAVIQCMQEAR